MTDLNDSMSLSNNEWIGLIQRVFGRQPNDRSLALLVDLPDARLADHEAWSLRRRLAYRWWQQLVAISDSLQLKVNLFVFPNARTNNAPLPDHGWPILSGHEMPDHVDGCQGSSPISFTEIFREHQLLLAPTELSATAPLKLAAREFGFRAATMPSFSPAMTSALRLDYGEVDRRCRRLKELLDDAQAATFSFALADSSRIPELTLDLRHRSAHVSSGLLRDPGVAGNLPSGETYIVPYEGEREADPSRSRGILPVELDGEVVLYTIEENQAIQVEGSGPVARQEAQYLASEPAYGNIAELGLGVLSDFGLRPIGQILLDEKLGLHIAFGRSDHFGGITSPDKFSSPDRVVHIDRVYLPETQPQVNAKTVDLIMADGAPMALMRDGAYVDDIFNHKRGEQR